MTITAGESSLRDAAREDIAALLPRIPAFDVFDLARGWGMTPEDALPRMFDESDEVFSIFRGGDIVAMLGISGAGVAWLMRGAGMERSATAFIRHAPEVIERWMGKYGRVEGYLSRDYAKFIRWFRYAGFEIEDLHNGYVRCAKHGTVDSTGSC